MKTAELVIFTRTFDLLVWLMKASQNFPRSHRHDFTRRLLDAGFDLRERLEEANLRKGSSRRERLDRADEALFRLKVFIRLAANLGWLTGRQYEHAAGLYAEVGRLLGGWQRATTGQTT